MQWAIDAWCGDGVKKRSVVMKTPELNHPKKETFRMHYCSSCECVWETDRCSPQYIHKYTDFPTRGIQRTECKYCEEIE